jgi:hypothetical protein
MSRSNPYDSHMCAGSNFMGQPVRDGNLHDSQVYPGSNIIMNQINTPSVPQPTRDVQATFIPRQYKVIISSNNRMNSSDTHGNFTVKLQDEIKNVASARLLNCFVHDDDYDYSSGNGSFTKATDFLTLHINQFNKNIGTTSGNAGFGDRLHDSFATIFYRGNTSTPGESTLHGNTHDVNHDVKYFDPPLRSLEEIKVNLYDNAGTDTGSNISIVFELLIETLDKVRVYR